MVLRALVQDAHPDKVTSGPMALKQQFTPKVPETATASLQTNLRESVVTERKP